MQCVILAGGLGKRVQHLTQSKPKALLPIGEFPFIIWQLAWLKIIGIDDVVLSLAYQSQEIENEINKNKSFFSFPRLRISYDGKELCGTGGAILKAESLLMENFLVTYGDSFLRIDPKKIMESHIQYSGHATLSIYKNLNFGDKSNIKKINQNKIIYKKKQPDLDMDYIDYGMLAINRNSFKYFSKNKEIFDLSDYLEQLSIQDELFWVEAKNPFFEIGSEEGYKNLKKYFINKNYNLEKIHNEEVF